MVRVFHNRFRRYWSVTHCDCPRASTSQGKKWPFGKKRKKCISLLTCIFTAWRTRIFLSVQGPMEKIHANFITSLFVQDCPHQFQHSFRAEEQAPASKNAASRGSAKPWVCSVQSCGSSWEASPAESRWRGEVLGSDSGGARVLACGWVWEDLWEMDTSGWDSTATTGICCGLFSVSFWSFVLWLRAHPAFPPLPTWGGTTWWALGSPLRRIQERNCCLVSVLHHSNLPNRLLPLPNL